MKLLLFILLTAILALPAIAQDGQTVTLTKEIKVTEDGITKIPVPVGTEAQATGRQQDGHFELIIGKYTAWCPPNYFQPEIRIRSHVRYRDDRIEQAYIDSKGDDELFRAKCEAIQRADEARKQLEAIQSQLEEIKAAQSKHVR